jgi:hypothetical protein
MARTDSHVGEVMFVSDVCRAQVVLDTIQDLHNAVASLALRPNVVVTRVKDVRARSWLRGGGGAAVALVAVVVVAVFIGWESWLQDASLVIRALRRCWFNYSPAPKGNDYSFSFFFCTENKWQPPGKEKPDEEYERARCVHRLLFMRHVHHPRIRQARTNSRTHTHTHTSHQCDSASPTRPAAAGPT